MKSLTAQPLTVYYIIDSVNHKNRPKYFLTVYEIVNGCEHRRQH